MPTRPRSFDGPVANASTLVGAWELGRDSLERHGPRIEYRSASDEIRRLRALAGTRRVAVSVNQDWVSKIRRIAATFSRADIDEIARAVRDRKSRFSISHLILLLPAAGRSQHMALARRSIRFNWTKTELVKEVQLARGRRRGASGRRPFVPADAGGKLIALEGLVIRWLRWTALASPGLPAKIRLAVRQTDLAVEGVKAELDRVLGRAEPKASGRRQPAE